jgi:hypothetical protein
MMHTIPFWPAITSITITTERIKITEAEVVYVAVDANRRKMKINRDLIQGDTSGIEQHETS